MVVGSGGNQKGRFKGEEPQHARDAAEAAAEWRDGLGRASSGRLRAVPKPLASDFWTVPTTLLPPILNPQGLLDFGYKHSTPGIQPRAALGPPAPTPIPRAVISEEPSAVPCHHHSVSSAPQIINTPRQERFSWEPWIPLVVVQHQLEHRTQRGEAASQKPGIASGRQERSASPKTGVKRPSGKKRFSQVKPRDTKIMMTISQLFVTVSSGKQSP